MGLHREVGALLIEDQERVIPPVMLWVERRTPGKQLWSFKTIVIAVAVATV